MLNNEIPPELPLKFYVANQKLMIFIALVSITLLCLSLYGYFNPLTIAQSDIYKHQLSSLLSYFQLAPDSHIPNADKKSQDILHHLAVKRALSIASADQTSQHLVQGLMLLTAFFFGIFAFFSVWSLCVKNKIVFSLDAAGIHPGRSFQNYPVVAWQNIQVIRPTLDSSAGSSNLIGIFMKDEESFYSSLTPMALKLAKINKSLVGTPFFISAMATNVSTDTLISWLNHYKNKYGSAQ